MTPERDRGAASRHSFYTTHARLHLTSTHRRSCSGAKRQFAAAARQARLKPGRRSSTFQLPARRHLAYLAVSAQTRPNQPTPVGLQTQKPTPARDIKVGVTARRPAHSFATKAPLTSFIAE